MAIQTLSFISLILRPYVKQTIGTDGWEYLFAQVDTYRNFDGEIFGLGIRIEKYLRDLGFRGSQAGLEADFKENDIPHRVVQHVNWLEHADVKPLIEDIKPLRAFKLKQPDVFTVSPLDGAIITKGYQCDWPPNIGNIG